jgi:hypothetical protein
MTSLNHHRYVWTLKSAKRRMAWNAARTEPPAISGCWVSANGRKVPSAVLAAPRGHSANELQREGCEADDVDHASQRLRPIFLTPTIR